MTDDRLSPATPGKKHPSRESLNVPREALCYLHRIPTEIYIKEQLDLLDDSPKKESLPQRVLLLPGFDYFMGIIIVANLIVMIIETDTSARDEPPEIWTEIFGYVALALFIFELLLRLLANRCAFFKDKWNIFDLIVVATDSIFAVIGIVMGDLFPVSMLRVFRLAKLARVSKVLRVFPELRLLLAGLMSSFTAIFWGAVLLLFCLLVWSMVAVQFLHPLNKNIDYGECERCPRAYRSCMSATLTFWQQIVTGDSWGQVTIPLIEKHPETAFFFVPMFLTVGMAVTNLILGVVVSVAQESKENLEEEEKTEKAFRKLKKKSHLLELCKSMDKDRSGELDHEEVLAGFNEEGTFRDLVLSLDITDQDFDIILAILDPDRTGLISYKDLVNHLCTMRNSDQQFMLAWIKYYIASIRGTIIEQMEKQSEGFCNLQKQNEGFYNLLAFEQRVEQKITKIEAKEDELLDYEDRTLKNTRNVLTELKSFHSVEPTAREVQDSNATDEPTIQQAGCSPICSPVATAKSSGSLQNEPQRAANKRGTSSVNTMDDMHSCLRKVSHDIETLRLELKDMLTNIDWKLGAQVASVSAAGQNCIDPPVKLHSMVTVVPSAECKPQSQFGSI